MLISDYKTTRYVLRIHMCKEKKIIYNRTTQNRRLNPPDIPEKEWSDFRCDYESGMTLKMIAEKYFCDPRTVRKSIMTNMPKIQAKKRFRQLFFEEARIL